MVNISVLNLRVVKESTHKYNVNKAISCPDNAYEIFKQVLEMDTRSEEIMGLLTLDTKNKVTGVFVVSQGTLSSSAIHPREIYKRALLQNAASIMIAHNHPSGNTTPSNEDVQFTKRLKEAGKIIGIELLDHLIIGDNNYFSLRSEGLGGF